MRELITTAQSISVPLTNGRGLTIADVPVTLHAEDGTLFATRWSSSGTQKTPLATGAGGATLAGEGQQLLVVYADLAGNAMRARVSTDGGRRKSGMPNLAMPPQTSCRSKMVGAAPKWAR